jgi:ATP-binding protein involved in chromosome partitioning
MSRIAVPLIDGRFSSHFGGAEQFALFDLDEATRSVTSHYIAVPPPHERGAFPVWLKEQGVTTVLTGGMGPRAVQILDRFGIEVVLGIEDGVPETLVEEYLTGRLQSSGSVCEGGGFHDCGHHEEP